MSAGGPERRRPGLLTAEIRYLLPKSKGRCVNSRTFLCLADGDRSTRLAAGDVASPFHRVGGGGGGGGGARPPAPPPLRGKPPPPPPPRGGPPRGCCGGGRG